MKKLIFVVSLLLSAASAFAQTDISKFEGTWKRQYTAFGPRREYIRIENREDGINVRFKQINEAYDDNPEEVFYSQGENVSYDGETIHCVVPYNPWGVKITYKITIKEGVLHCWFKRIIPDDNWEDKGGTVLYYNENDNW